MVSRLMATSGLKATVFDAIGRSLTPLGFRRRGTTFRRELAQVVQLVQVQTSQSSSSAVTKLTVNLAVLAPSLSNDRFVRPAVEAAHWRQRIGHLMPGHRDLWWSISDKPQAMLAASEIADRLARDGVPGLSAFG